MNFDENINRVKTHSAKWDLVDSLYGIKPEEAISMWVADMDFRPPQGVIKALQERINHGVLGYFADDGAYKGAFANWLNSRHQFQVKTEQMTQVHGLVQGVSVVLNALTQKGDGIITFNPVYHAFGRIIRANERDPIECPLKNDDGTYEMDLEFLETQLKGHEKLIILCSPHNPGGRVWTLDELRELGEFAKKHDLYILSDEIHMDLVYSKSKHIVFGNAFDALDEKLIYLFSATKTFNIAGALTGTIYAPHSALHARIMRTAGAMGISANLFGMLACTAAFETGASWVDSLVVYLEENARIWNEGVEQIPGVHSMKLEATYLSWVDFRALGLSDDELHQRIYQKAQIAANDGSSFGVGGEGFVRFNLATPRKNVVKAIERLQRAFQDIQ